MVSCTNYPITFHLIFMEPTGILIVVITCLLAVALVIFLIRSNRKDRDLLNPDTEESVEETHRDIESREDRT